MTKPAKPPPKQVRPLEVQVIGPDAAVMLAAIEKTSAENAALRATVERLKDTLQDIADPLGAIKRKAAEQGAMVEGWAAVQLCNDPGHLRGLARAALESIPATPPHEPKEAKL